MGHVRKRSDDLQKRLATDPPASNTKCPDTHVRQTPRRTPDVVSGPVIQRESKSLNAGQPYTNANGPVIRVRQTAGGQTTTIILESPAKDEFSVKFQWKEGVLTAASGTTILEFFKPSSRGSDDNKVVEVKAKTEEASEEDHTTDDVTSNEDQLAYLDDDDAAGSNKQSRPIVRLKTPQDLAKHPKRPENRPRKKVPKTPKERRVNHRRDEEIFTLLEEEREKRQAAQPGEIIEHEEMISTLQWWKFDSKNNSIKGRVFNRPRCDEDKYKDGSLRRLSLNPDDVPCLQEGSLIFWPRFLGGNCVIRLGAQHEPKTQTPPPAEQQTEHG